MGLRQRAASGVFWTVVQFWGRQPITLVVFAILARLLEPQAFGLVALAGVFIAFTEVFIEQGFSEALVQRKELDPLHLDSAFWTNMALGVMFTLAALVAAEPVAVLFKTPEMAPVIAWLSLSFVINAAGLVQGARFQREMEFRTLALRSLVGSMAGGAVGVGMALAGYGVWALVGLTLSTSAAGTLLLWAVSPWRPRLRFSTPHFRELAGFGASVMGLNLVGFVSRRSPDLFIGSVLGPVALGYYTIAHRILLLMTRLMTHVLYSVSLPVFARLQGERQRLRLAFLNTIELSSTAAFPAFVGAAMVAPQMIAVLFGKGWEPSVPVWRVLAMVGLMNSIAFFNASVMSALGKPAWRLAITLAATACTVAGISLVIRSGILAVALVVLLCTVLSWPVQALAVRRLTDIGLRKHLGRLTYPVLGSVVMAGALHGLQLGLAERLAPVLFLLIVVPAGAAVYLLVLAALAPQRLRRFLEMAWEVLSETRRGKKPAGEPVTVGEASQPALTPTSGREA